MTVVQTPFCLAVITNQCQLVERLLQLGSDVTAQIVTERGQQMPAKREQALHFAASKGQPWIGTLRVLLRSPHVDIDVFNSDGLRRFRFVFVCISRPFLLLFVLQVLSHFRAVVSVIVIAFLSSEHYFIIGVYSYFYSYGLLLKLND